MAYAPNTVEGMLGKFNQGFLYSRNSSSELVRSTPGTLQYNEYVEEQRRN
ncbi:hypothetical protein NEMIN01_2178 [Nematocida minor]|nr:uncharacterized protein NEMIN01_2178 [Nematocida minor]KAI5192733.1 hypothetical protein NEMIN01_2178 [Nematocida minor]